MPDNPIFEAVVDGLPVPKDDFRDAYLSMAIDLPNLAALRAMNTRGQKLFFIEGKLWRYDAADTISVDDGVTCVIDLSGVRRYKRQIVDAAAELTAYKTLFKTDVAAVLADTTLTYAVNQIGTVVPGDTVQTKRERYAYRVLASAATDFDVITAGGVKLLIEEQDGWISFGAYGLLSNQDAGPAMVKALARANVRGKRGDTYLFSTYQTCNIPAGRVLDVRRCWLNFWGGALAIKSEVVATGRTILTNVANGSSVVSLNNVAGIEPGMLLYIRANAQPLTAWTDYKNDLILVHAVSGSNVTLAERLNFHYDAGEAGLAVEIYRPHKLSILGAEIDCVGGMHAGQAPFELYHLKNSVIEDGSLRGPVGFDPALQTLPRGFALYQCWNTTFRNIDADRAGYPILPNTGSRNTTVYGITGRDCRHLVVPSGFCSGTTIYDLRGSRCYQALDGHPSFRTFYINFVVEEDTAVSNVRTFGGGVKNGFIHTSATNAAGLTAQYGRLVVNSGYTYLKDSGDFIINDITFNAPNRTAEMIGCYTNSKFVIDFLRCAEGQLSLSVETLNDVSIVAWGSNNLIGATPHFNIRSGGSRKARCKVDSRAPAVLNAYLDASIYHIDPHRYGMPTMGRVMKCSGQIASQLGPATSVVVPIRIHTHAWPDLDVISRVLGKITITGWERNNSSPQKSSVTNTWDFEHYVVATSLVKFNTTPLGPAVGPGTAAPADTAITMTLANVTQAGNTQLGPGGDVYVQFDLTLNTGWPTSVYSLSYELELNLMSPA